MLRVFLLEPKLFKNNDQPFERQSTCQGLQAHVPDRGHDLLAGETTSHSVVNTYQTTRSVCHSLPVNPSQPTLGLSPRLLDTMVAVRLVALEVLGTLLDDRDPGSHFD